MNITNNNGSECFECTDCGSEVSSDAKSCPNCGVSFQTDIIIKGNAAVLIVILIIIVLFVTPTLLKITIKDMIDNPIFRIGQILGFLLPNILVSIILGLTLMKAAEKYRLIIRPLVAFCVPFFIYFLSMLSGAIVAETFNIIGLYRILTIAIIYCILFILLLIVYNKLEDGKISIEKNLVLSSIQFGVLLLILFIYVRLVS